MKTISTNNIDMSKFDIQAYTRDHDCSHFLGENDATYGVRPPILRPDTIWLDPYSRILKQHSENKIYMNISKALYGSTNAFIMLGVDEEHPIGPAVASALNQDIPELGTTVGYDLYTNGEAVSPRSFDVGGMTHELFSGSLAVVVTGHEKCDAAMHELLPVLTEVDKDALYAQDEVQRLENLLLAAINVRDVKKATSDKIHKVYDCVKLADGVYKKGIYEVCNNYNLFKTIANAPPHLKPFVRKDYASFVRATLVSFNPNYPCLGA
jgi:hypothetical protein